MRARPQAERERSAGTTWWFSGPMPGRPPKASLCFLKAGKPVVGGKSTPDLQGWQDFMGNICFF